MSLTITSRIQSQEGFELTNAYGRVAVVDQYQGNVLQSQVEFFIDEQAFLDGKAVVTVDGLNQISAAPYDRAVDGTDILDLAHDNLIALLAQQNIVATKNL